MRKANYASPSAYDYLHILLPPDLPSASMLSTVGTSDIPAIQPEDGGKPRKEVVFGSPQYFSETHRIFKQIGFGDSNLNHLARQRVQEMRQLLDEVEARLRELD